ncbi:MAG TPA: hypothetical protein VHE53_00475 [Patescibacteria group bacterium]|nr:hypothetical protein [Patescibacteria group bacterium]
MSSPEGKSLGNFRKAVLVGAGIATAAALTLSTTHERNYNTDITNPKTFDRVSTQYSMDRSQAGADPTPSRIKPPHTGDAGIKRA